MAAQDEREMRDLIVRLDESVKLGFQHINAKLDEMTRRADGHETRIRALENWHTEVRGGAKSLMSMGKIGYSIIGALAGIVAALGFQFAVVPKDKPVDQHTTVQSR